MAGVDTSEQAGPANKVKSKAISLEQKTELLRQVLEHRDLLSEFMREAARRADPAVSKEPETVIREINQSKISATEEHRSRPTVWPTWNRGAGPLHLYLRLLSYKVTTELAMGIQRDNRVIWYDIFDTLPRTSQPRIGNFGREEGHLEPSTLKISSSELKTLSATRVKKKRPWQV